MLMEGALFTWRDRQNTHILYVILCTSYHFLVLLYMLLFQPTSLGHLEQSCYKEKAKKALGSGFTAIYCLFDCNCEIF